VGRGKYRRCQRGRGEYPSSSKGNKGEVLDLSSAVQAQACEQAIEVQYYDWLKAGGPLDPEDAPAGIDMTSRVPRAISAIQLMQQRPNQQNIDVTFEQDPLANDYPSKVTRYATNMSAGFPVLS
jgi:hypothetical protein